MTKSRCGARTRAGTPCQHEAGRGTDHVGEGRCKLHGGRTPRGVNSPHFRHGKDSAYFSPSDIEGFDEWRAALGPTLDLSDDVLALAYVAREQLLRGEPVTVMARSGPVELRPTLDDLTRAMLRIAQAAEKLWVKRDGVVVRVVIDNEEALELFDRMGRIVARHVKDPETRKLILEDFERIMVREGSPDAGRARGAGGVKADP